MCESERKNREAMSHGGSEFEQVVELVFQNVQYLLTVALAPGDTLCVEAEHKTDGSRWRGDFTARYIEDITQKTGNFKKFAVFVKMLRSSILQESDSVFVDLLTYQDLEMLKNRKSRDMGLQPFRSASSNKRYLILTYTGEFDRVHYPLPLLYEENPEPEALKRTIRRLRDELEDAKNTLQKKVERRRELDDEDSIRSTDSQSMEIRRLREENDRLTAQLSCMEDSYRLLGRNGHSDHREIEDDRRKLAKELILTQKKCDLLFSKLDAKKDKQNETQTLRARLDQLQEDLRSERSVHRKATARFAKENTTLMQEVKQLREAEKTLRVKMRESESELDLVKRRMKIQGARDLPPCRTRPRGQSPVPSTRLVGGYTNRSRRSTPLSSRANSPAGGRITPGSRPSSCPSFGSAAYSSRRANNVDPRGRSLKELRGQHAVQSQPSSARSTDPYDRAISRSVGSSGVRARQLCAVSSQNALSVHGGSALSELAKTGRAREKMIYNTANAKLSPDRIRRGKVGLHPLRVPESKKGSGTASTPNGLTSDDENELSLQGIGLNASRGSSPGTVLRDVKAKLAKYAKMEGIELSDTDSHGSHTTASLKDLSGNSSPRPGRYSVVTEMGLHEDKEVLDIDSRLHALQTFLKSAKARVRH